MNKLYKCSKKVGIGGIACPCCVRNVRTIKRDLNRAARRAAKKALKVEAAS